MNFPVFFYIFNSSDGYDITFSGFIEILHEGTYQFRLDSDNISTLKINGKSVITSTNTISQPISMRGGYHPIIVEYKNVGDPGIILFKWKPFWKDDYEIIPPQYFSIEKK